MPEEQVKYRGVAFEFGERILIVPPLSTQQLEDFADKLDKVTNPEVKDFSFKTWGKFLKENMVPITLAALQRNYPELTEGDVFDFLNSDNYGAVMNAFLGLSKENKVRVGEPFPAVMPGPNSTPAIPSPVSTGPVSEPALPAPQAGPGDTSVRL